MKKFAAMVMVLVILVMGCIAHGEATPTDLTKVFGEMKVFQTEGELKGTWTIGFQRDENNRFPCALDLGDGRIIIVPLTDDEVNSLIVKALEEHKAEVEEANKEETSEPSLFVKAIDFVTFWN